MHSRNFLGTANGPFRVRTATVTVSPHHSKNKKEREKLIAYISREVIWPVQKSVLVNKYLQQFSQFRNSIDFEKL
jgi:hypothetical protein